MFGRPVETGVSVTDSSATSGHEEHIRINEQRVNANFGAMVSNAFRGKSYTWVGRCGLWGWLHNPRAIAALAVIGMVTRLVKANFKGSVRFALGLALV